MNFEAAVKERPVILAEGSVIERIRRFSDVVLDPLLLNTPLVYDPAGQEVMKRIFRSYADVGREFDLPMILLAPTWRASSERLSQSGFDDVRRVNGDCVRFVCDIRDWYGDTGLFFVGGIVGCAGDAYRAEEALGADEAVAFHKAQTAALAGAGVDFMLASTIPSVSEAMGIARAMAGCGVPYIVSFIVRREGTLLDGTPLVRAMDMVDEFADPSPLFYMINCVHPEVMWEALTESERWGGPVRGRVVGLQANTSSRTPEELDGLDELDAEDPSVFADSMLRVHREFGVKILGGCCGTDERHIRCIAERVSSMPR
jgi:S-methylmethionine-dependent homocysteine/selenocysteine methylase